MELKCLRTFRTIIDEGGFSKAAKKLNYTQSTITFQMNQLERDLSTTLFEKIGRKMVLTNIYRNAREISRSALAKVCYVTNFPLF